uniref:Uncharacterized protein n=1 Tax=Alexandrium catenella TaxID=2925 RepID=A0A7S1WPW0_ALECA
MSSDMPSAAAPGARQGGVGSGWASAMDRVLSDEPVQILPETLRSLSSSSLTLLAGADDEAAPATPEAAAKQRQGRPLGVLVEAGRSRATEKRSQDTPLSAKDASRGGSATEVANAAGPGNLSVTGASAAWRSAEGKADDDAGLAAAGSSEAAHSMPAFAGSKAGGVGGEDHAGDGSAAFPVDAEEPRRRSLPSCLVDSFSATGITVKNTFLDFAPREEVSSLRTVRTAAGRLDLMGQE